MTQSCLKNSLMMFAMSRTRPNCSDYGPRLMSMRICSLGNVEGLVIWLAERQRMKVRATLAVMLTLPYQIEADYSHSLC